MNDPKPAAVTQSRPSPTTRASGGGSGVLIVRRRSTLSPFAKVYGPMVLDERISDGAFRTLELLDLLAGADGEGRHGLALIARLRKVTSRTIENHVAELEAAKLVSVERRRGHTNRVVIEDPEAVYGREAIAGFFHTVHEAARSGFDTPENGCGGTPEKNFGGPPKGVSHRAEGGGAEVQGTEPCGAPSPPATEPTAPPSPDTAPDTSSSPTSSSGPPDSATHVHSGGPAASARSESGIRVPGAGADPERTKAGAVRKRRLYDPDRPLAEWRAQDAVGYFRLRFARAWPTEPPPDVLLKDLGAVRGRLAWLDAEKVGRAAMREAIDHLFEKWDLGLKERIRWEGSRPGLVLIESARWFERILRDFRGDRPRRADFWDPVAAARCPPVGWGPILAAGGGR